jgi:hypothetical protein
LGNVTVPLDKLVRGEEVKKWYDVDKPKVIPEGKKGSPPPTTFGQILMGITALDFGLEPASAISNASKSVLTTPEVVPGSPVVIPNKSSASITQETSPTLSNNVQPVKPPSTTPPTIPQTTVMATPLKSTSLVTMPNTEEDKAAKIIQDAFKNHQSVKESVGKIVITLVEAKDLIPAMIMVF